MQKIGAPLHLQLAVQGGAAKICILVAAFEAIQELQSLGLLKVTRVSGTSAGAIVGTLFAAGVPMSTVKAHLMAPGLLDEIITTKSRVKLISRFARGKALWSDDGLRRLIERLIGEARPAVTTFEDIQTSHHIPVQVLATDIRDGKKRVYGGDDPIVNSVLDSCAVPFGFRAAFSGGDSSIVDGGISENLPSELLTPHTNTDGPVVAISFKNAAGKTPTNAITFAMALMNAAMNNSVERAKRALGDSVLELETDIQSFDWETAIAIGFDAEYGKARAQAEKFFRTFVGKRREQEEQALEEERKRKELQSRAEEILKAEQGRILSDVWASSASGDHWAKQYTEAMVAAGTMFRVQHSTAKLLFDHCEIVVTAWSLLEKGQPRASEFDEVRHKAVMRTLDQPIYCHSIGLSHADHETLLRKSEYEVTGPDQKKIETIKLLMSEGERNDRRLLLCFNPILPVNSGPFTIRFVDEVKGFLRQLQEGQPDEIVLTVRRAHQDVRRIELILYAPNTRSKLRLIPKTAVPYAGRPMTEEELDRHKEHAPFGFNTFGWVGENIPAGYKFGPDVYG